MRAPDDLVAAFCRGMPARVAEATELWLGYEQGRRENLATLRRLLHTVKGEAHMLDYLACSELAELAESVVDVLRKAGEPGPLTGDALLGAFEGMGMLTVLEPSEEPADLDPLIQQLNAAIKELEAKKPAPSPATDERVAALGGPAGPRGADDAEPESGVQPDGVALRADDVRPLVHELRRLQGEHGVLHVRLRESLRMLRALLSEIDPRLASPESLVERITKTLSYGTEVDHQLSAIRAEWSSNDFTMGLVLDELDGVVRRASVVSTAQLLNKVQRVARSAARTLEKEVDVRVRGEAILETAIEQRLEPALLHLVRNAIDHGIDSLEARRARGKPSRGQVEVCIGQNESSVIVEVSDDGAGVDFERLRKVLAGRVVNLEDLRDDDLLPFLFEQGVTTSSKVTAVSGRGVGLDVVAREIGAAGGQVRVESKPEVGTKFILQMPTTLRSELAVPVACGDRQFAIPSRSIHSVMRLETLEHTVDATWVKIQADSSASLVRLFSLGVLLGFGGEPKIGDAAVVLYHASGLYALSVERYDNPRPITIQRSEELPFSSAFVRGVAPTPDGGVLLLLDLEAVHASTRDARVANRAAAGPERKQARALVVEDAPVARELLCGILRSIGMRVEEATDGRQGLMMARSDPPDVVLTDIEMPYMDGIEMVTEFRRSPTLARLPVIVLSTAATDENRNRLQKLGVAAVLSKRKFVEAELRQWIDRCVKARA